MTPKKRDAANKFKRIRKKWAAIRGTAPARNPAYLRWIRNNNWCLLCEKYGSETGTPWRTESAHSGPHGISQKASDLDSLPLCGRHHRTGKDSYHVLGTKFFQHHGLDREQIISRLRSEYEEETGKKL